MIPILFGARDTVDGSNGLGRLVDAISCEVEEERNGSYELEIRYPVTGQLYDQITLWSQIVATAFRGSGKQTFRVYKITKPLDGIVTINAQHISYDLKRIVVSPYTAAACSSALSGLKANMQESNPFTFWTDKTTTGSFKLTHPENARNILGGHSGSILDTYGAADYEFDNYAVKLWTHRGSDKGVTIRYGKNLTDLEALTDMSDVYASIVPYWASQDGKTVVSGSAVSSGHSSEVPGFSTVVMDFSQDFEETPTAAQLEARAAAYLANNEPWEIKQNLTVSFVSLADTEEYKDIASLETVNLCDTVHIYHPVLDVTASAKVIRTRWDVLRERYIEIELGSPRVSLYEAINPVTQSDLVEQTEQTSNFLLDSMAELIAALCGVDSGHIVFNRTADGHISEIYAMDTDSTATATNVLRINYQGIYASTNGINGTYNLAITTGGTINASQILTGVLRAIEITNGNGTFHVDAAGNLTASAGTIGGWQIASRYLYKDVETQTGDKYRFFMQPPDGVQNVWVISGQKYNPSSGLYERVWSINADGSAYLPEIISALMVDGKLTAGGAFEAIGAATFDSRATFKNGVDVTGGDVVVSNGIAANQFFCNNTLWFRWNGTDTGRMAMTSGDYMYFGGTDVNRWVCLGQESSHWGFFPWSDTYLDLGLSGKRWDNVYAQNGTIQTSDKRQKKSIKDLGHKALELIAKLRPVSFLMRKGTSGRRHWGLIAQDVEEAMKAIGFTDMDFAGLIKDEEGRYGLRYEEFIAPLILAVQDLNRRVEALEEGKKNGSL